VHVRPATASSGRCRVCFEVSDTGIGIPTDVQSALFQRFMQADSSTTRRFGGTGLGLAICKRLAELMGGEIGVHSLPGVGATFWFTVEMDAADHPGGLGPGLPPEDLARHRALVVDDNATNRKLLDRLLGLWRMPHAVVDSGDEALQELHRAALAGQPYDLVILDYQMPGMDGLMLADAIRVELCLGRPALVLLTSLGDRMGRDAMLDHGLSACESKPLHPDRLRATLVQVLTVAAHADPVLPPAAAPVPEPPAVALPPVLVAEDNVVNQKVARLMLRNLGYAVDVVTNGFEAVAAVQRKAYALVLMDAQMPVMDGLEATRRIRAAQAAGRPGFPRHLPIVAMTANAMTGDRELCLAAGMNDYLAKPVRPEELRAVLARLQGADSPPCA
jgi:CheY-like chemotaxis protein